MPRRGRQPASDVEGIDFEIPAQHAFQAAQHRLPCAQSGLQRGPRRAFDQQLRPMYVHHLDDGERHGVIDRHAPGGRNLRQRDGGLLQKSERGFECAPFGA